MRIFLILAIISAIIYFSFDKIRASMFKRNYPDKVQTVPNPQSINTQIETLQPIPSVKLPNISTDYSPDSSTVFFTHTFKNRLAPRIPSFLNDTEGIGIALDVSTNTWIIQADESQAPHLKKVVALLDISPEELDLDFVLLAVSEKWIRSLGVDLIFKEGANYLSSVGIFSTSGGLRFASGGLTVNITGEKSNDHVSVYRTPVVRVMEGEDWSISETVETPIPVTQTADGITTTSIQFAELGLVLKGKVSKGSKGWRLDLEQFNGSKGADISIDNYTVPEKRTQKLKTAVYLEANKWTICGGVRNIEAVTKTGIFYKKKGFTKDLILIFCRPRTSIRKVYKAVPVWSKPPVDIGGGNQLLPNKEAYNSLPTK